MIEGWCEHALLPTGWSRGVRLMAGDDGRWREVVAGVEQGGLPLLGRYVLPGMPNLHSHAFQRAMAGHAERYGRPDDSFWTWREEMYRHAGRISPEQLHVIARWLYAELLECGYTRVAEFHYLHHGPDGRPYAPATAMADALIAAAGEVGIGLTLLPVLYQRGGFSDEALAERQRRFAFATDDFLRFVDELDRRSGIRVGCAIHSLRAVGAAALAQLLDDPILAATRRPIHIHIAEQLKEVSDCLAFSGKRPVDYLLAEAPVGPDWCLIHATHLTDAEVKGIADCGAVVGLCPITEANLGDGVFPAAKFLRAGGRVGIGTDSNVEITAAGEMKMLEYSQRLVERGRNICADAGSTGARLYQSVLAGGSQALGAPIPALALGAVADCVALKDSMAMNVAGDTILDRWIFGTDLAVSDVWVGGAHVVRDGRHVDRSQIIARATQVCRNLI